MQHAEPRALSRRRLQWLLSSAKFCNSTAGRIDVCSRLLLGLPYQNQPLIGSAAVAEQFTASLERFDCVTYIETLLALGVASNADEFMDGMRRIRYENGSIGWKRRNHYMTGWIRSNVRAGLVRRLSFPGADVVRKERTLNVVPGLQPVHVRFACTPKSALPRISSRMQSGDLIFFASTRAGLDIFHCGVIVWDGDRIRMRHASRSRGAVVEQDLKEFLALNRMSGVIVVRPVNAHLHAMRHQKAAS